MFIYINKKNGRIFISHQKSGPLKIQEEFIELLLNYFYNQALHICGWYILKATYFCNK